MGFRSSTAGCRTVETPEKQEKFCKVFLYGPICVKDQGDIDLTPRNQKSRAVLAMLAVAPRGSRSRVWLRDKLWSDRAEDQGSASLRQALLDIRKSLGPYLRDVLFADKYTVTMDLSRVTVDIVEHLKKFQRDPSSGGIDPDTVSEFFLEGIDIRDPEFETWLTMERQVWAGKFLVHTKKQVISGDDRTPVSENEKITYSLHVEDSAPPARVTPGSGYSNSRMVQWAVGISDANIRGDQPLGSKVGALFRESLVRSLVESGKVRIIDLSEARELIDLGSQNAVPAVPLIVRIDICTDSHQCCVTTELLRPNDHSLFWTARQELPTGAAREGDISQAYRLIGQAEQEIVRFFMLNGNDDGMEYAGRMHRAVTHMFSLSSENLDEAEKTLTGIIKDQPTAQAFAWMAFAKSFRVGQRFSPDVPTQIAEAQYFASRALELDDTNALVLSLVAHIHSFLFNEYDLAASLFERALKSNPTQPMGWDLYAMLHAYTGQHKKAQAMARWVQNMGKDTPYSYYFDTTKCIASSLAGQHRESIAAGERALQQRPQFNSILRYLISSHAHLGNTETVSELVSRLRVVEPDFSLAVLKDTGNPMLITEGGQHFLAGLEKAGFQD